MFCPAAVVGGCGGGGCSLGLGLPPEEVDEAEATLLKLLWKALYSSSLPTSMLLQSIELLNKRDHFIHVCMRVKPVCFVSGTGAAAAAACFTRIAATN